MMRLAARAPFQSAQQGVECVSRIDLGSCHEAAFESLGPWLSTQYSDWMQGLARRDFDEVKHLTPCP